MFHLQLIEDFTVSSLPVVIAVPVTGIYSFIAGVPTAQCVKRCPAKLEARNRSGLEAEIRSTLNGVPLQIAFPYHPHIVLI